uniref:hypothetical protein n=1 Tax=uncultured Caulobacter sp. TaxID=158749 RepID=UPI0025F03B08|nr:hypothetical protein [uncultured Caulobacter sp.]
MGSIEKILAPLASAGAPWWALCWMVVAVLFFIRGPAVIKAISAALLEHRKHNLKRDTDLAKVRNSAVDHAKAKQLPASGSRSAKRGAK